MTGSSFSVAKREKYWKEKRVFFLTPQIVKNDIQSGILVLFISFSLFFNDALSCFVNSLDFLLYYHYNLVNSGNI
jgi:hypothetical protein